MRMGSLPNLKDLGKEDENLKQKNFNVRSAIDSRYVDLKLEPKHFETKQLHYYKILRHTRSLGTYDTINKIFVDQKHNVLLTVEGNVCSPSSSRSTRSSCTLHQQVNTTTNLFRRASKIPRESISSSAATSSVRHLISTVRATSSKNGPIYNRRHLIKNFAALCLGHAMITAAFIPLIILQGSISLWWWQQDFSVNVEYYQPNYKTGSYFLCLLFTVATFSCLFSKFLIFRIGANWILIISYSTTGFFFCMHLYPNKYTLIPAYILMGAWLGPHIAARNTCLMSLVTKMSHVMTEDEEAEIEYSKGYEKMEIVIHKLSRGLQIAQDVGIVIGNFITAMLIWCTKDSFEKINQIFLSSLFAKDVSGDRICGYTACPTNLYDEKVVFNTSNSTYYSNALMMTCKANAMLISIFLGFCVMGVAVIAVFLDKLKNVDYKESKSKNTLRATLVYIQNSFKDCQLILSAPLAMFIGLEQGFIFSDFSKSYIACSLGIWNIALAFLCLGLLRSIAAYSLNLTLQHVRRHFLVAMGYVFQILLIAVLILWKPTKEDPALFYVVPGVWGVCDGIWDTLSFSLIMAVYQDSWQASIANIYFFRFMGLAIAYGFQNSLCTWLKVYILTGFLSFAVVPYFWLEQWHEKQRKANAQCYAS